MFSDLLLMDEVWRELRIWNQKALVERISPLLSFVTLANYRLDYSLIWKEGLIIPVRLPHRVLVSFTQAQVCVELLHLVLSLVTPFKHIS